MDFSNLKKKLQSFRKSFGITAQSAAKKTNRATINQNLKSLYTVSRNVGYKYPDTFGLLTK